MRNDLFTLCQANPTSIGTFTTDFGDGCQPSWEKLHDIDGWGCKQKTIYLLSNLEGKYQICRFYGCRYWIVSIVPNQKSRGFHIHKSYLSDPAR